MVVATEVLSMRFNTPSGAAIGAGNPEVFMVGNIIQRKFLDSLDYPAAAALGFVLVGVTMALVTVYTRLVGSERLTT